MSPDDLNEQPAQVIEIVSAKKIGETSASKNNLKHRFQSVHRSASQDSKCFEGGNFKFQNSHSNSIKTVSIDLVVSCQLELSSHLSKNEEAEP